MDHIFNGNMEYFTSAGSTKNAGLVDIYLNLSYKLSDKLSVKADYHNFSLQNKYTLLLASIQGHKDVKKLNQWFYVCLLLNPNLYRIKKEVF